MLLFDFKQKRMHTPLAGLCPPRCWRSLPEGSGFRLATRRAEGRLRQRFARLQRALH